MQGTLNLVPNLNWIFVSEFSSSPQVRLCCHFIRLYSSDFSSAYLSPFVCIHRPFYLQWLLVYLLYPQSPPGRWIDFDVCSECPSVASLFGIDFVHWDPHDLLSTYVQHLISTIVISFSLMRLQATWRYRPCIIS